MSAAQRLTGALTAAHWPIGMYIGWANVHAIVQGSAVHHVTSLGSQKYIFKVQGLM
jgi:hypothetical protein